MPRDIPVGTENFWCVLIRTTAFATYIFLTGKRKPSGGQLFQDRVWVNGRFSWIGKDWKIDMMYVSTRW